MKKNKSKPSNLFDGFFVRNFRRLKTLKMYQEIRDHQQNILNKLNKEKTILSTLRLILLGVAVYFFYLMLYNKEGIYGLYALLCFVFFLVIVNVYSKKQ